MKSWIKGIFVFGGILLLSAFLAPILFKFVPYKFERIFNRLVMIFSLIAVARFVRIRKETLVAYGLQWNAEERKKFTQAFFAGGMILLGLSLAQHHFGAAVISFAGKANVSWIGMSFVFFSAAILIGFIEEFFFRGFLFQTFLKKWRWGMGGSILATSVLYSLIHFVSKEKIWIDSTPTFFDSLRLIEAPLLSFMQFQTFWPAAVGLFIFGLILNDLVIRHGSLYPAIGLHAGCVFYIKCNGLVVDSSGSQTLLFGSDKLYDGILGWIFLGLLWGILRWVIPRTKN